MFKYIIYHWVKNNMSKNDIKCQKCQKYVKNVKK